MNKRLEIKKTENQFENFPGTRYMGSKNKIVLDLWEIIKGYDFNSFYDAFSGSNVVGYYMKCMGKQVLTNDFMAMSYHISKAIIENHDQRITKEELEFLLKNQNENRFITNKFKGIYFSDLDNLFLDQVRENINHLGNQYKKSIALSALVRACMKKRPRGIFTFVGHRYDDGRKDLQDTLEEHFTNNIEIFNNSVFENNKENKSYNLRTEELNIDADLVYLDPPYFSPKSDNDYVRRYHFVEGLVKNWDDLTIQENTKTKKFKSYPSPFANKLNTYAEFDKLFCRFKNSIIVVSYSSNSLPTKDELIEMMLKYKEDVKVYEIDHLYSFGNQAHKLGNTNNRVKEYLFIGK